MTMQHNEIQGVDVVEWSRALDVRLIEWCCSVSMVWGGGSLITIVGKGLELAIIANRPLYLQDLVEFNL
jgi:hypothetical protein